MKEPLLGKNLKELEEDVKKLGLPRYTANQIADWLYQKDISSIEGMTNISKKNREKLINHFKTGIRSFRDVHISKDGTKKYLFPVKEDKFIESAYIPEVKRNTLCISSQVGCKMGCLFCMTGKQGFQGNLSAGEIINQIVGLPEKKQLTNIVYMGMGEPFDNTDEVMKSLEILRSPWGLNFGPRRITVSTIGIIPGMRYFLEHSDCHLAVSLHSPFDDERQDLLPVQSKYPVREVLSVLQKFDLGRHRRLSFEYIMFKDLNDSHRHVNELARLLNKVNCRINLISFHPIPGTDLNGSDDETIMRFQESLNKKGIRTTIRASRGQDIFAACGLLSTKVVPHN